METPIVLPAPPTAEARTFWLGVTPHVLHLTAAETDGALGLFTVVVPPQEGPPPHVHYGEAETFYVLAGEFEVYRNGETIVLGPGGTAHVPSGTPHTFRNVGAQDGRLLVAVTPGGFEGYFAAAGTSTGPEPMSPALVARMMAAAPDFHLAFLPPTA